MNNLTVSKLVLYLSIIFLAGAATGAVITLKQVRGNEAQAASTEKVCSRVQDRLKAKLALSNEQVQKLQPIFDQTAQEIQNVRGKAIKATDDIIRRAHQLISKDLNEEQKQKLLEFDRDRQQWILRQQCDGEASKAGASE
jgi:hypothetical protein